MHKALCCLMVYIQIYLLCSVRFEMSLNKYWLKKSQLTFGDVFNLSGQTNVSPCQKSNSSGGIKCCHHLLLPGNNVAFKCVRALTITSCVPSKNSLWFTRYFKVQIIITIIFFYMWFKWNLLQANLVNSNYRVHSCS